MDEVVVQVVFCRDALLGALGPVFEILYFLGKLFQIQFSRNELPLSVQAITDCSYVVRVLSPPLARNSYSGLL